MSTPQFVAPELCKVASSPPSGHNWIHEVKFDGYRMQLRVDHGHAVLRTRKGLDWSGKFPEIAAACRKLPDCVADGEIVALDDEGVSDFAKLQAALSDGETANLVYFLFDLMSVGGRDLRTSPLSERKQRLEKLLKAHARSSQRLRYVSHFVEAGDAMLDAACRMKLEGIISKRLDAPYRSGRSADWLKSKCRGGQEVVIGGWRGDSGHLRSLLVGVQDGDELRYMGRVGTGFNVTNTRQLIRALQPLRRATPPFANRSEIPDTQAVTWVKPRLVAEVEFGTITRAGLLRQASYKGLREDKGANEVVAEPQPSAARRERKVRSSARPAVAKAEPVSGVTITNAGKILWPAAEGSSAVTKADLAQYFEAIALRILPHIEDRPLSIVRAPDGIDGQRFFQRHAPPSASDAFISIPVAGETKPFVGVDSVRGLVALAQAAVLEIHPWGCRKGKPEIPERIVFDLDPAPDVPFEDVMAAAKTVGSRLKDCGLIAFLKTTGGKGLHVVTAIEGTSRKPATWAEAKTFAQAICAEIARDEPASYTTNMSKAARNGKIFLDYLRNDRMATAVAPWSPRARAHAPVALPVPWTALRSGLDPAAFTIRKAGTFLRRADPWKDLAASAGSLRDAMRTVVG